MRRNFPLPSTGHGSTFSGQLALQLSIELALELYMHMHGIGVAIRAGRAALGLQTSGICTIQGAWWR